MPSTRRSGGVGVKLQDAWEDGPFGWGTAGEVLAPVPSYSLGQPSRDTLWVPGKDSGLILTPEGQGYR